MKITVFRDNVYPEGTLHSFHFTTSEAQEVHRTSGLVQTQSLTWECDRKLSLLRRKGFMSYGPRKALGVHRSLSRVIIRCREGHCSLFLFPLFLLSEAFHSNKRLMKFAPARAYSKGIITDHERRYLDVCQESPSLKTTGLHFLGKNTRQRSFL